MPVSKLCLTADDVRTIGNACLAYAQEKSWPVTIAILDDGGHPLWLQRADGAAPVSASIALAKARTAALSRRESKFYEEMLAGRPAFLSADGLGCLLEGGLPILLDGHVVGAIGVSGVRSNEDSMIAQAGVAALGQTSR